MLHQTLNFGLDRLVDEVDAGTLRALLEAGEAVLIDVREIDEFAEEHIPGALHFPLSSLDPADLPRPARQRLVLQCLSGGRSARARERLHRAGLRDTLHLSGGLLAWKEAGGPTKTGAA